jgi:phenylacetate-CoA ligase
MKQLRPDGIVAVPSLLLALGNQARRDGEDLAAFAPRKAMLIGDAIRTPRLGPNSLGRALETAWGGELFSTYGLTEAGLAFHECPAHQGLHSHPDLVVVEIDDAAAGPGRRDRRTGVITSLQMEGMPPSGIVRGCHLPGSRRLPLREEETASARSGSEAAAAEGEGTTLYPKTIEDALAVEGVENWSTAHTGDDEMTGFSSGGYPRRPWLRRRSVIRFTAARVTPEIVLPP